MTISTNMGMNEFSNICSKGHRNQLDYGENCIYMYAM